MSEYVNTVELEFDGNEFTDFSAFSKDSVEKNVRVLLMNKTGHARKTPRYGFSTTVATPVVNGVDISETRNGTCTAVYEGGKRTTYGGVYVLEDGEQVIDGETPANSTVSFSAETRIDE